MAPLDITKKESAAGIQQRAHQGATMACFYVCWLCSSRLSWKYRLHTSPAGEINDLTGEIEKLKELPDAVGGYADIFKCVWRPLKKTIAVCTFFFYDFCDRFWSSYNETRSLWKLFVVTVYRRVKRVDLRKWVSKYCVLVEKHKPKLKLGAENEKWDGRMESAESQTNCPAMGDLL